MLKSIIVHGSHGRLKVAGDGVIVQRSGYEAIARFDVVEFIQQYGRLESTDILHIGFWKDDGSYVPPDEEARELARGCCALVIGADDAPQLREMLGVPAFPSPEKSVD